MTPAGAATITKELSPECSRERTPLLNCLLEQDGVDGSPASRRRFYSVVLCGVFRITNEFLLLRGEARRSFKE
eukprot:scaffold48896_cov69-Cyclotella_meneghiniana.AAC.1